MNIQNSLEEKRQLGQYMTPGPIAKAMCNKIHRPAEEWVVLDPACGDGELLLAAVRQMKAVGVTDIASRILGVDIDARMIMAAKITLAFEIGCSPNEINVIEGDFFELSQQTLLERASIQDFPFNVIISNPPYGKLREYRFFETCYAISRNGTELVFLVPLAFADRITGPEYTFLEGRPMGVTTGHAMAHIAKGMEYQIKSVKIHQGNSSRFDVLNGIKLYERGGGTPPQTIEIVRAKPYSSERVKHGWLPCVRTGDIQPFSVTIGRLWVNYGEHLAHPKTITRFQGPRLFVRRMPIWATRRLGAVYIEELALCAGDVLVIRHMEDNPILLKGLCAFLNSAEAADVVLKQRPSLAHRMSYPKIAAKDLNALLEHHIPTDETLTQMAVYASTQLRVHKL